MPKTELEKQQEQEDDETRKKAGSWASWPFRFIGGVYETIAKPVTEGVPAILSHVPIVGGLLAHTTAFALGLLNAVVGLGLGIVGGIFDYGTRFGTWIYQKIRGNKVSEKSGDAAGAEKENQKEKGKEDEKSLEKEDSLEKEKSLEKTIDPSTVQLTGPNGQTITISGLAPETQKTLEALAGQLGIKVQKPEDPSQSKSLFGNKNYAKQFQNDLEKSGADLDKANAAMVAKSKDYVGENGKLLPGKQDALAEAIFNKAVEHNVKNDRKAYPGYINKFEVCVSEEMNMGNMFPDKKDISKKEVLEHIKESLKGMSTDQLAQVTNPNSPQFNAMAQDVRRWFIDSAERHDKDFEEYRNAENERINKEVGLSSKNLEDLKAEIKAEMKEPVVDKVVVEEPKVQEPPKKEVKPNPLEEKIVENELNSKEKVDELHKEEKIEKVNRPGQEPAKNSKREDIFRKKASDVYKDKEGKPTLGDFGKTLDKANDKVAEFHRKLKDGESLTKAEMKELEKFTYLRVLDKSMRSQKNLFGISQVELGLQNHQKKTGKLVPSDETLLHENHAQIWRGIIDPGNEKTKVELASGDRERLLALTDDIGSKEFQRAADKVLNNAQAARVNANAKKNQIQNQNKVDQSNVEPPKKSGPAYMKK